MIVTVTPNPALDVTYTLDRLDVGGVHHVDEPAVRAGGKGLNVARVIHQVDVAVTAIATVGGPAGDEFRRELESSGVPHHLVPSTAATRRSTTIVDRATGSATVLNEHGEQRAATEWNALEESVRASLGQSDCVTASGSLPPGTPAGFYARIVTIAHEAGLPAVIDTRGPELIAAAHAGADIVKPNRAELEQSTGLRDPLAGARMLIDAGARLVLVSLGEDGMLAVPAEGPALRARLPKPLTGNPTGAGDAAVAAAAMCLAEGIIDAETVLRRATALSAAAVLCPVAGEVDPGYGEFNAQLLLDQVS